MPQFLYAWQARSFCSFFTKMNCDPRKTVGLKKRDSLKCAGASQQTLEQRSSLWNWPRMKQEINKPYMHCFIAEHTFMTAQQLLSIIPQLNSTWYHIHVCCQPLLMKPFCKTSVITCHCRDHCGYMTSNNKEDSYQIVLFLFINTARLLCQKLYCLEVAQRWTYFFIVCLFVLS